MVQTRGGRRGKLCLDAEAEVPNWKVQDSRDLLASSRKFPRLLPQAVRQALDSEWRVSMSYEQSVTLQVGERDKGRDRHEVETRCAPCLGPGLTRDWDSLLC